MKKLLGFLLIIGMAMIQPAAAEQLNRVAAVVNGNVITMYDLERNSYPELARAHVDPRNPAQKDRAREIMNKVLDMMILDVLYQNEARRLKVEVTDAEVDKEITNMYQSRRMTRAQFEQSLARDGMTLTQLRRQVKSSLLRQRILGQQVGAAPLSLLRKSRRTTRLTRAPCTTVKACTCRFSYTIRRLPIMKSLPK